MKRFLGSTAIAAGLVALIACQRQTIEFAPPPPTESPSFTTSDDGGSSDAAEADLASYCPSSKCPAGWTTCPTSRFACDVNLLADREHCGACGHGCDGLGADGSRYECSEGHCLLACDPLTNKLDCDGIPDNGCEADITTNDNCGGCGVKCADPEKPCLKVGPEYHCGCPADQIYCGGKCVDPRTDDDNCGGCNIVCDPAGDGGALPPNTYYGCLGKRCGQVKCQSEFRDCDSDLHEVGTNGCEANLWSKESCGGCGNVCGAEQECYGNEKMMPTCSCPAGQVYCPYFCLDLGDTRRCIAGMCADLSSDKNNCGACFHACEANDTGSEACLFGVCANQCDKGRADCNGNETDGCEVDIDHDPNNCGACGRTCDGVAGQACVGGRCVVEPCDSVGDDGGLAR